MVALIGVTSYGRLEKVVVTPSDYAPFFGAATYVDEVRRAGGAAVVLPGGEPHVGRWLDALDGDAVELVLTRAILARSDVPALFICRGIQVLNVALSGTLHEHIGGPDHDVGLHQATFGGGFWTRESVQNPPNTILARVAGCGTRMVSSSHHQAIRDVAPGLLVSSVAADGTVEAVELEGHPFLLGVQWHPEVDVATDLLQARLFEALVEAAGRSCAAAHEGIA